MSEHHRGLKQVPVPANTQHLPPVPFSPPQRAPPSSAPDQSATDPALRPVVCLSRLFAAAASSSVVVAQVRAIDVSFRSVHIEHTDNGTLVSVHALLQR
jgi:hypothetical protein